MAEEQYKTTLGDRVVDMGFKGGLFAGTSAAVSAIVRKFEFKPILNFFDNQVVKRLPEGGKLANFAGNRPIAAAAAVAGAVGALYSLVTYSKKNDIDSLKEVNDAVNKMVAEEIAAARVNPAPAEEAKPKTSHADKIAASRAETAQRVAAL